MKTLKKTLCLVLVLALTVSMFAVAASAASYDKYADAEATTASKYAEAMDVAIGLGIINGVEGNKVAIDNTLNRAMAAKILCYMLVGADASEALAAGNTQFSDVPANHWANKYISYAAAKNYLVGSNGKFNPGKEVTGYQFAKMVLNAMGEGIDRVQVLENGVLTWKDVNEYEGTYWSTYISVDANRMGLFAGLKGVDMNKALTRGQAMQMVFNALKYDINNNDYYIRAYAIAKDETNANIDAYGRSGYSWKNAATDKAVSGAYNEAPDFTYNVVDKATNTLNKIIAAYNKANGLTGTAKAVTGGNDTAIAVGTVVEVYVAADYSVKKTIQYSYELDTIKTVASKAETTGVHKGAYAVTTVGNKTLYTDDLSIAVKKDNIVVVPVVGTTYVWKDAALAVATESAISEYAVDNSYIVVAGSKIFADGNYTTSIANGLSLTNALGFKSIYNIYTSPVGTVLGVTVKEEKADYTANVAWLLNSQAQPQGSDATTDLIGNVTNPAGKNAAAVIQIVDETGAVKLLNVAVAKSGTKYVYAGTDAKSLAGVLNGEVVKSDAGAVAGKFVEYYIDANGNAVIVGLYSGDDQLANYTKGSYSIAGTIATSKTTLKVVRYNTNPVTGKTTYAVESFTGYKNFPAITDVAGNKFYVDAVADVVYAYAKVEAPSASTVDTIAYCAAAGNYTANGYAYTFIIDGNAVTYYDKDANAATAKTFYKNVKCELTAAGYELTTNPASETSVVVTGVDAGYYTYAGGLFEYPANTAIYDLTSAGAAAIAKGDTVIAFVTETKAGAPASAVIYILAHAE